MKFWFGDKIALIKNLWDFNQKNPFFSFLNSKKIQIRLLQTISLILNPLKQFNDRFSHQYIILNFQFKIYLHRVQKTFWKILNWQRRDFELIFEVFLDIIDPWIKGMIIKLRGFVKILILLKYFGTEGCYFSIDLCLH